METALATRVYNFIFDSKGGETDLLDLTRDSSPMEGFTEARATELLSSSQQEDPETKNMRKIFAIGVNSEGRKTVRILCKARICFSYVSNGRCSQGAKCRNLHICRGFLEDNCNNTSTCSKSHNFLDKDNESKLQKMDSRIVKKQHSKIRSLVSKNLPCVCKNYLTKQCRNTLCPNLHICSRYVRDACCSEENACPSQLSHDLTSSHNKKIFKNYQVPENYLKCNTLLPKGIKIGKYEFEKLDNGEKRQRSKVATSMNNLDRDDDGTEHAAESKFMGFTQNICQGKEDNRCLATSGNVWSQNSGLQHRCLQGAQTNPIPSPNPQNSNIQKWVSVGCFEMAPSYLPTCLSDKQNMITSSCSVPRGLGGKEAPNEVGMAGGMSYGAQPKPVSWAGRGRGRPLQSCSLPIEERPGQDVQSKSSKKCQDIQSMKNTITGVSVIFNCILTKFNGRARFSDISFSNDPVFRFPSIKEKDKWFRKHKSRFLIIENDQGHIEEVKTISPKAKMCQNYLGGFANCGSKRCSYFHICKDFVANGKCSQLGKCTRNHGFHDGHNKKLASDYFPDDKLTEEQLRQLIKSSTPQVCMDYNERKCVGSGLHCKKIHVCKNYVSGKCNGRCNLLHERGLQTSETKEILAWLNVGENTNAKELLRTFSIFSFVKTHNGEEVDVGVEDAVELVCEADVESDVCACKTEITYHINASSIENPICMKFLLLEQCDEERSCADHHCPMPYQWVYMVDNKWDMFNESENINLEKFFCDENLEDSQLVCLSLNVSSFSGSDSSSPRLLRVSFSRMEVQTSNMRFPLKRLSTQSAVHVTDCPLATKWRWLKRGPDGKFKEYYQQSQMDAGASIQVPGQKYNNMRSVAIEKHYLEGHGTYDYEMAGQRWTIYFKETPMYQRNVPSTSASIKEEVERRPVFISQEEVKTIRKKPCVLPQLDTRQLPSLWTKMAECQDHLLVRLSSNTKEYQEMESLFLTHMRDKLVTDCSIDRIQNPFLWEKYTRKKNQMRKMAVTRNDDPDHVVDERLLFHATSRRNIRRICKHNFDWRSYGEGAPKIYGEGVYFSKDPSLIHWFSPCDDEDGCRYIFIFKVLVGCYTEGKKSYRHPPPRDPLDANSEVFDSCVDRVGDPQVFVVFDVDQYYPGYLIEYKSMNSSTADLQTCSVQ